jgi:hypothetical protein
VRAYNTKANGAEKSSFIAGVPAAALPSASTSQASSPSESLWRTRLGRYPEADRMRLNLGRRFLSQGKEVSVLLGTLTVDSERHPVRVFRYQRAEGERVEIGLDGAANTLSWTGRDGARAAGNKLSESQRALIERVALDSVDQFILGQLSGAGYQTIAQNVAPEGASLQEDYSGPSWNIIRVDEPTGEGFAKSKSNWRLYYVNTVSGLIDKVISNEAGSVVTADILAWSEQSGERFPVHIKWTANGSVVMELILNNVAFNTQQ